MRRKRETIPNGADENHIQLYGGKSKNGRERRRAPRPSTKRTYSFDFLNTSFNTRDVIDSMAKDLLDIDTSTDTISKSIKNFLALYGKDVDFTGMGLSEIISKSESLFSELNLNFNARKKYGNNLIQPYVYVSSHVFDFTVLVFYCSPAENLSEEVGLLYKKFIKYISQEMSLSIGLDEDNFYLSAYLDMYCDEEMCQEDDYYMGIYEAAKSYREGDINHLFKSIEDINLRRGELRRDLEDYLKNHTCPEDEIVSLMLEGLDYIGNANVYEWSFNEDDDGFNTPDHIINLSLMSMILYDPNDKLTDGVIDAIDNDYGCGVEILPWQKGVNISDLSTLQHAKNELNGALNSLEDFHNWFNKFYKEAEKYYNEQSD